MDTKKLHNISHILIGKIVFSVLMLLLFVVSLFVYQRIAAVKGSQTSPIPVLIMDGEKIILGQTSTSEIAETLKQNRVTVYPEDKVRKEITLASAEDNLVGLRVTIERAPVYMISVDGNLTEVRSWAKTIGEVIAPHVVLGPRDIVEPKPSRYAVPETIIITRINVVEEESTTVISYATSYQDDYYAPTGSKIVLSAGVNGSKKQLHRITYKNGTEVSRILISESVISYPKNQSVKRGIMPSSHPDFKRSWWDVMVTAGIKYGISPLALFKVAACESHVNPNSTGGGGTYLGMYQYTAGFWSSASAAAGFAGSAWSNGTAQIYATARYASLYGWSKWSSCAP